MERRRRTPAAIYKGDVPATIELRTNPHPEYTCRVDFADYGEIGFALTPSENGTVFVSQCHNGHGSAEALRLAYELSPPVGRGPPGFLVGVEVDLPQETPPVIPEVTTPTAPAETTGGEAIGTDTPTGTEPRGTGVPPAAAAAAIIAGALLASWLVRRRRTRG